MAGSWHAPALTAGSGPPGHSLTTSISWSPEAFFLNGNPYLGRTVRQEPVRRSNVLSPTGDTSDGTSILCGHRIRVFSLPFCRFRQPRPESGGGLPHRSGRDRAPRRAAQPRGPADPVDAGREPGEMAPRPHHLVLRAVFARRALRGLYALPPRLCVSVQFLLRQRRSPACPPPARPFDPPERRRSHRLSPACRRGDREILPDR